MDIALVTTQFLDTASVIICLWPRPCQGPKPIKTIEGHVLGPLKRGPTQAPFIWSRVPETTLPPSYPGRGNFKLISLQNQPDRLH